MLESYRLELTKLAFSDGGSVAAVGVPMLRCQQKEELVALISPGSSFLQLPGAVNPGWFGLPTLSEESTWGQKCRSPRRKRCLDLTCFTCRHLSLPWFLPLGGKL